MATSVSWSVHRLFEQRTDGWTTPDSNSTGTSSVCLPNSTWDFIISIYRAAQRMNCQVCFRSWPSLHPHTCRQHVWWDIPTELKVTVSGSDLSAVRQRKCFRAGRRLTWPAPPHRPPQVTELNFVTSFFSYRKRKDELFVYLSPAAENLRRLFLLHLMAAERQQQLRTSTVWSWSSDETSSSQRASWRHAHRAASSRGLSQ